MEPRQRRGLLRLCLPLTTCLMSIACCTPSDEQRATDAEQDVRLEKLQAQVDELGATTVELQERIEELEAPRTRRTSGAGLRDRPEPITARCEERDGAYVFPDLATLDTDALVQEARVIPHYEDGGAVGFKLYRIREDSLLRSCGFQSADVIRSVNGRPVFDPESALEVYSELRDAKELVFEIERGSTTVDLRIASQ